MSFVSMGDNASTRPTFFEISAADSLMPSLKAATIYSLSVFAQQRHYLHRLLAYEDEFAALIAWFLDRQSLLSGSASFSDSLYGLRRAAYKADDSKPEMLTKGQQRLALLHLVILCHSGIVLQEYLSTSCWLKQVGVPYLQAKLHKIYERHSSQRQGGSAIFEALTSRDQQNHAQRLQLFSRRARQWALAIFLKTWPLTNSIAEGLTFLYQMLYLVDKSPYYSPILHLLRQNIVRVSGNELASTERQKQASRRSQLRRAKTGFWLTSWLRWASMKAGYILSDHTRNALILAVFAFKLLEWWYTSGEQRLGSQKNTAVPPPPPLLGPHPDGIALPKNPETCPLCRRTRTNPAMAVPSGYVFCYPCIFDHVSQYGCCPVTRLPANIDQIRRLYQSQ